MESVQQPTDPVQAGAEKRLTFDEHIQQLPSSKQSFHRMIVWFIAAAIILTLGVFVYATYASFTWNTVGGSNVVQAWMYFLFAGAVAVFLLGLDTLIVGATIPLPTEGSKYDYESGRKAVRSGWGMVAYGVAMTVLVIAGVARSRQVFSAWRIGSHSL